MAESLIPKAFSKSPSWVEFFQALNSLLDNDYVSSFTVNGFPSYMNVILMSGGNDMITVVPGPGTPENPDLPGSYVRFNFDFDELEVETDEHSWVSVDNDRLHRFTLSKDTYIGVQFGYKSFFIKSVDPPTGILSSALYESLKNYSGISVIQNSGISMQNFIRYLERFNNPYTIKYSLIKDGKVMSTLKVVSEVTSDPSGKDFYPVKTINNHSYVYGSVSEGLIKWDNLNVVAVDRGLAVVDGTPSLTTGNVFTYKIPHSVILTDNSKIEQADKVIIQIDFKKNFIYDSDLDKIKQALEWLLPVRSEYKITVNNG